ncbi:hypothetical protein F2Q69_00035707 [Brassica cretica]|uniref:Uncharacterized protein n=1 Tax=Brassica cretica TaxID=69181 RepID=A0A8S9SHN4_BRACR|nr:hypothetical protein F2Q69_00035707 [Brassica cretica]
MKDSHSLVKPNNPVPRHLDLSISLHSELRRTSIPVICVSSRKGACLFVEQRIVLHMLIDVWHTAASCEPADFMDNMKELVTVQKPIMLDGEVLFDKFAEISHENLQLLKDKAMLKAHVNILDLEQPTAQTPVHSAVKESDQEVLSLKRAMAEHERNNKKFEDKFKLLSDLLVQEMDKSKLLESQLTEKLKMIRMLPTGTEKIGHLLTWGKCLSANLGLGFQGATSKLTEARLTKKIECVTPTSLDPVEIKTKDEAEEESGHEEARVTKKIECVTPTSFDPVEIKTKDEVEEESEHEEAWVTKKIECVTPTSLDPVEIKTKDEAEEESGHEEVEVNMD